MDYIRGSVDFLLSPVACCLQFFKEQEHQWLIQGHFDVGKSSCSTLKGPRCSRMLSVRCLICSRRRRRGIFPYCFFHSQLWTSSWDHQPLCMLPHNEHIRVWLFGTTTASLQSLNHEVFRNNETSPCVFLLKVTSWHQGILLLNLTSQHCWATAGFTK